MNERVYIEKICPLISPDNINEEMLDVLSLFVYHNYLSIYQNPQNNSKIWEKYRI